MRPGRFPSSNRRSRTARAKGTLSRVRFRVRFGDSCRARRRSGASASGTIAPGSWRGSGARRAGQQRHGLREQRFLPRLLGQEIEAAFAFLPPRLRGGESAPLFGRQQRGGIVTVAACALGGGAGAGGAWGGSGGRRHG
jgi:hypothetical protein